MILLKKLLLTGIITSLFSYYSFSQNISNSSTNSNDNLTNKNISFEKNNSNKDTGFNSISNLLRKARNITYMYDFNSPFNSSDYWQNPYQTDSLKTGDCEDKSIYLHKLLKDKGINSKLTYGVYSSKKEGSHMWVEIDRNDTTYILDPANFDYVLFRDGKNISGNVSKNLYHIWEDREIYLDYFHSMLIDYNSRNSPSLELRDTDLKSLGEVNMGVVFDMFDIAEKISYVHDSVKYPITKNYWQSPAETKKLGTGDCEDKAFYLQELLDNKNIYSHLVYGKNRLSDKDTHVWVELYKEGFTYILDPTENTIHHRGNGLIKGTVLPGRYVPFLIDEYINFKIIDYHMRNDVKLVFKNKK